MAYNQRTSLSYAGGTDRTPDFIYYNADIVNNSFQDLGVAVPDPELKFDDGRASSLLDNPQDYQFSIIRFTMDGANLDLPLFIPEIAEQTSSTSPLINQTTYSLATPYLQTFTVGAGVPFLLVSAPAPTFIEWAPQNLNPVIASPPPFAPSPQNPQNYNSRYYWCNTYDHWLGLVNTAFQNALLAVWNDVFNPANPAYKWVNDPNAIAGGATAGNNPFVNYLDFVGQQFPPYMTYFQNYFSLYADVRAFGEPLNGYVGPVFPPGVTATQPVMKIYFNNNMNGLFSNFPNQYWNVPGTLYAGSVNYPPGYVYEILVRNLNYTNILDNLTPTSAVIIPPAERQQWWVVKQEYTSIDSLWSPISSIVFTSSALCVRPEATSAPLEVGTGLEGNVSTSNPTSNSPFQNIITDIALPMVNGAQDYRQFISYAPTAQYRYSNFNTTQALSRIDIRVFWKNRFTNELFPILMYNSSSVSIKMLFRKKSLADEKY